MKTEKIRYSKTKKVCVCHNTTVLSKKDVLLMRDTCKNNAKTMMLILKLMYGWTWFFKISESENSTHISSPFTSSSSNIFPDSDFDDNKKTCSAFKR